MCGRMRSARLGPEDRKSRYSDGNLLEGGNVGGVPMSLEEMGQGKKWSAGLET